METPANNTSSDHGDLDPDRDDGGEIVVVECTPARHVPDVHEDDDSDSEDEVRSRKLTREQREALMATTQLTELEMVPEATLDITISSIRTQKMYKISGIRIVTKVLL